MLRVIFSDVALGKFRGRRDNLERTGGVRIGALFISVSLICFVVIEGIAV